jgi:hypothetical protein
MVESLYHCDDWVERILVVTIDLYLVGGKY